VLTRESDVASHKNGTFQNRYTLCVSRREKEKL